jgi:pyridoxamine 5'-phosphate oxidase
LAAQPRVEICAYDPRGKVQIRARGTAERAVAAGAEAAWKATGHSGRVCYRTTVGPGTPLDDPALMDPKPRPAVDANPNAGREHFSVVVLTLEHIDWLYLAARGHRRAGFDWHDGRWVGRWLAP